MFWKKKNEQSAYQPQPWDPWGIHGPNYKQVRREALLSSVELPIVLLQRELDHKFPATSPDRKSMRRHLAIELLRMILGFQVGRRALKITPGVVDRSWQKYQCKGPNRISCDEPPFEIPKCSVPWLAEPSAIRLRVQS